MRKSDAYKIIKHQHVTEKSRMLQELKNVECNPSIKAFENPKYVFVVDKRANKASIANAIEEIHKDKKIKVVSVNTINLKAKKRRVRGRLGKRPAIKKAIVTLEKGDNLENI